MWAVMQYLVEEAVASGIEEIIFVTGRGKRAIEDHFDVSYELEDTLVEKNKHELLDAVRKISSLARFSYVRQPVPLGDGHALLQAAHLVDDDESVLVIFGDCLYDAVVPASRQLIETYEKYHDPVIGLSEVAHEDVSKFGVIEGVPLDECTYEVKGMVEKPKPEDAPSNLVAVGKYIITPEVFKVLESMKEGKSGGPAGCAAAVYAARKQLTTALVTTEFGGQSVVSEKIYNWIGTPEISGSDLAKNLESHVRYYEGEFLDVLPRHMAEHVSKSEHGFTVKKSKATLETKSILVTTGSSRRKLEIPGADQYENRGVVYCASCDGPLFSGQEVVQCQECLLQL
jgi:UTP-glucose-1-phosphate uridylyltransferase